MILQKILFSVIGLFLECPGTTAFSLRQILQLISSPIQSLSVYDFDRSVTSLPQDLFAAGVNIRHLQFSHSHLQVLKENSLKNLYGTLESLSIVNGKLTQVNFNLFFYLFFFLLDNKLNKDLFPFLRHVYLKKNYYLIRSMQS